MAAALVTARSLRDWKETLAIVATYASGDSFSSLLRTLAERLANHGLSALHPTPPPPLPGGLHRQEPVVVHYFKPDSGFPGWPGASWPGPRHTTTGSPLWLCNARSCRSSRHHACLGCPVEAHAGGRLGGRQGRCAASERRVGCACRPPRDAVLGRRRGGGRGGGGLDLRRQRRHRIRRHSAGPPGAVDPPWTTPAPLCTHVCGWQQGAPPRSPQAKPACLDAESSSALPEVHSETLTHSSVIKCEASSPVHPRVDVGDAWCGRR